MDNEVTTTPEAAENASPEVIEKEEAETVEEVFKPKNDKPTVGLDKFLDLKNDAKEKDRLLAEKEAEMESLRQKLEEMGNSNKSNSEISDDIDEIAEAYDIDKDFLKKFAKSIESKSQKGINELIEKTVKPLQARQQKEDIDKAFNAHFEKTIKDLPEYRDIVNPEVIKTLSLDPKNSKKTFAQIIEEAYGSSVKGKATLESTKPAGGKEPEKVDVQRAKEDPAYFKEVMSDPRKKKEYNDQLIVRIGRML